MIKRSKKYTMHQHRCDHDWILTTPKPICKKCNYNLRNQFKIGWKEFKKGLWDII